jgi:hypothetical protein
VKNTLDEYLNPDKKWEDKYNLLSEYCNKNKCEPQYNTNYKNNNIGMWFNDQKKKINNVDDELYKKLSTNKYIKNNLDDYLNPDKKWKELCELLFKYCDENECSPHTKTKYENQNIGSWLQNQKNKINNSDDELYKKLSANEYIKDNLDQYLKIKESNKNKEKLEWKELCELLFKYCSEHKCVPSRRIKYENQNIGIWLQYQKNQINGIDDELYTKLSVNPYIKNNLNKYIKKKNSEMIQSYTLNDIAIIEYGKQNPDIKSKQDILYQIPYYTSIQIKYCKEPLYNEKCILIVKTPQNQGKMYSVNGSFNANKDIIIIKLKSEFASYYNNIFNALQNDFNYNDLIKNNPIRIKTKDSDLIVSNNIGLSHIKNFTVNIEIKQTTETKMDKIQTEKINIPIQVSKAIKKKNIEVI